MKVCRVFVLTLLLPMLVSSQRVDQLEGCLNPNAISGALEKIKEAGWQNVSLQRLRSIWPRELDALDCDTEVCRSVWSKDRIIEGHCQCCATFYFEVQHNPGGQKVGNLQNIIINYTSHRREDSAAAAKSLARAFGLGEVDLATVGNSGVQNFTWKGTRDDEKDDLYGLEVRFTPHGTLWELYFNVGRHTIAPSSGATP